MSKYLEFNQLDFPSRKTKVFEIRNKDTDWFVGTIDWDTGWRRYIFTGNVQPTKLDEECLVDIAKFIGKLMKARQ